MSRTASCTGIGPGSGREPGPRPGLGPSPGPLLDPGPGPDPGGGNPEPDYAVEFVLTFTRKQCVEEAISKSDGENALELLLQVVVTKTEADAAVDRGSLR